MNPLNLSRDFERHVFGDRPVGPLTEMRSVYSPGARPASGRSNWVIDPHRSGMGSRSRIGWRQRLSSVAVTSAAAPAASRRRHAHDQALGAAEFAQRRGRGRRVAGDVAELARRAGAEDAGRIERGRAGARLRHGHVPGVGVEHDALGVENLHVDAHRSDRRRERRVVGQRGAARLRRPARPRRRRARCRRRPRR